MNQKTKKKLAPRNIKTKKEEKKPSVDHENDDFEFPDDLLDEVFNKAETAEASETIDLDDWIPKKLKEHQRTTGLPHMRALSPIQQNISYSAAGPSSKIMEGPKTPLASFKQNISKSLPSPFNKSSMNQTSSYSIRKDAMFTSREFEEDSTLRLRFLKRDVACSRLQTLSSTSQIVALTDALKFTGKNWFTYGVVSEYGELRKGGSGRIDITDLTAEPYSLRCLLFNSAYNDKEKIPVGSIVCLLNPTKAKPYNGKEALLLNDASQILIAGTSRDFGLCSGKKKAGGSCQAVVNMNICRYCKFHAVTEYKQQQVAKDLKAAAAGVGLGNNTHRPGLWNAQATQAASLNPAKKNLSQVKKDNERLNKLNFSPNTVTIPKEEKKMTISSLPVIGDGSRFASYSLVPPNIRSAEKRKSDSMSLPNESPSLHQLKKPASVLQTFSAGTQSPKMSLAKKRALQFAREHGGIVKEKPKPKYEEITEVKENPSGITEDFLAAMREKPRDAALLESAEALERDKRFERLQVVEEIGEKLAATHEVPVRAIRCLVCKKNYHQMPLQCVMNKHKCSVVTGTKRFFECNGCRARTTTLERFPAAECTKCGVWSWKKAGMAADRTCTAATQLSVRGLEEKFVGSVIKDPNLNLLVPDIE